MDLASVIIAGIALLVSGWSAYNSRSQTGLARRSAEAARQAVSTAQGALRQNATPEWSAMIVDHTPSKWHSLELRLKASPFGDVAPGGVLVEIPTVSRMQFSGSQYGVDGPSSSRTARTPELLGVGGGPVAWRVQFNDNGTSGNTDLRVTCQVEGMTWTVAVPVDVPADPPQVLY